MNKNQALAKIEKKIEELGIPPYLIKITKVPSSVECSLIVGHQHFKFNARSGVSEMDLDAHLDKIAEAWYAKLAKGQQVDIEDAVEVLNSTAAMMGTQDADSR